MYASNAEQNGQIRSYKCPCCSNKFPNADLWKKHVDVCVQPRSRVSPNQVNFKRRFKENSPPIHCPFL